MEIEKDRLDGHTSEIDRALRGVCELPAKSRYVMTSDLSRQRHVGLVHSPAILEGRQRSVTNDLGRSEQVYGLSTPESDEPRFWIGLGELWDFIGVRRLAFVNCGLRVYAGRLDEAPTQVLRLEWTAADRSGSYQGGSAAHPHWHVDRAALVRGVIKQRALHALENVPLAAVVDQPIEDFLLEATNVAGPTAADARDYSWVHRFHLPAHACWMNTAWDGEESPGPHQCEPQNLTELNRWWVGALRYVSAELRRHAI